MSNEPLLFADGARSALAREFSMEVRARLAAMRRSGKWLAEQIGLSQNYVAKRLRDEACFTLDDLYLIAGALGAGDAAELLREASERHTGSVHPESWTLAADDPKFDADHSGGGL